MTAIVLIIFAAIAFWLFGGVALRWAGVTAAALGFAVALGVQTESGLLVALAGSVMWLFGHLHYRLRHGDFKSGLAGSILGIRA